MTNTVCITLSDRQFQIYESLPKGVRSRTIGTILEAIGNLKDTNDQCNVDKQTNEGE